MKEAEAAAAEPPKSGGKGKESLSNADLARLIVVKPVSKRMLYELWTTPARRRVLVAHRARLWPPTMPCILVILHSFPGASLALPSPSPSAPCRACAARRSPSWATTTWRPSSTTDWSCTPRWVLGRGYCPLCACAGYARGAEGAAMSPHCACWHEVHTPHSASTPFTTPPLSLRPLVCRSSRRSTRGGPQPRSRWPPAAAAAPSTRRARPAHPVRIQPLLLLLPQLILQGCPTWPSCCCFASTALQL